MAEVIRCENGHYYDKSVFIKCPHCEETRTEDTKNTAYRNEVARYAMEYMKTQQGRQNTDIEIFDGMSRNTSGGSGRNLQEEVTTGKNVPRRSLDKEGKTIGFSANSQKNIYVTGWLVCVEGPHRGCSFNLYYGYNTVGYSRSNRICLLEDLSVAKKVHCSVIYEDRKNAFYVVPEENQITYLNSVPVEGMGELQTGDLISVGKTTMEFIAFCRGERRWDRKEMQKAISKY